MRRVRAEALVLHVPCSSILLVVWTRLRLAVAYYKIHEFRFPQHTPVTRVVDTARVNVHDGISLFQKQGPLCWFGEEVGNHLRGGAVFDSDLLLSHFIFDVKIPYFDVLCPLGAGQSTIIL